MTKAKDKTPITTEESARKPVASVKDSMATPNAGQVTTGLAVHSAEATARAAQPVASVKTNCRAAKSADASNIVIGDRSALHFLMHYDAGHLLEQSRAQRNPLVNCAASSAALHDFNLDNPLYGQHPIDLLVPDRSMRRSTRGIECSVCRSELPPQSFYKLRQGLFLASPELVFLRMARKNDVNVNQLAEIGMRLCARYYLSIETGKTRDRIAPLTTPAKLQRYLDSCGSLPGTAKGKHALRYVLPNSASPMEDKTKLQICHPLSRGGFSLPFTNLNYDFKAGRARPFTEQSNYSIDLANPLLRVGIEYDGEDTHPDPSKDKRRRNELNALGWTIFPLDKDVLFNAAKTINFARQVAKYLGIRLRFSASWEQRYSELRHDLGLPV